MVYHPANAPKLHDCGPAKLLSRGTPRVRLLSAGSLLEVSGLEIAADFVSFLSGPDNLRYDANGGSCIKVADSANAALEPLDEAT